MLRKCHYLSFAATIALFACGTPFENEEKDAGSGKTARPGMQDNDAGLQNDAGSDSDTDSDHDAGKDGGGDADADSDTDTDTDTDSDVPYPDPNRYHWDGSENPFFEGWYYKVTDPEKMRSFFFIYSVQNPGAPLHPSSGGFLYIERDDGDYEFYLLPLEDFSASRQKCDVVIGESTATEKRISGYVPSPDGDISWNLDIDIMSEWGKTMGALTNVPGIPVNWYVNALKSRVTGSIDWRGEVYELEDAPGYNDHNWGPVFPEAWLWIQANGFEDETEAIAFAGGPVPLGPVDPSGYMLAFKSRNRLYEFRTQDLTATFDVEHNYLLGQVQVIATKGNDRVVFKIDSDPDYLREVLIPTTQGMVKGGYEAFFGTFTVNLWKRGVADWNLVSHSESQIGVVEFGGSYAGF